MLPNYIAACPKCAEPVERAVVAGNKYYVCTKEKCGDKGEWDKRVRIPNPARTEKRIQTKLKQGNAYTPLVPKTRAKTE